MTVNKYDFITVLTPVSMLINEFKQDMPVHIVSKRYNVSFCRLTG